MRIPRIYTPQSLTLNSTIELDENASRHIGKVLRMDVGRDVIVFNGQGGEYRSTVSAVGKKIVSVHLSEFIDVQRQSPLQVELAIGISRGERFDWVLQKATELGVSRITPLFSERTEVKLNGARLESKVEHWQQILISACEQCQLNIVPQLNKPISLQSWLPTVQADLKLVSHHRYDKTLAEQAVPQSVCLLIGPEGGLSDAEINAAHGYSFTALTLGPRVFRTETAPIAALALLQYLWGDFSS